VYIYVYVYIYICIYIGIYIFIYIYIYIYIYIWPLTTRVSHAPCTQHAGGVFMIDSGDVTLSIGSVITGCSAFYVRPPYVLNRYSRIRQ